jgi:hypothetical protein
MALDAAIGIGAEATYGTAATTTTGYEGKADSWKTSRDFIESVGFRRGLQTARADRRNIINMGGEGELEVDLLDGGAAPFLSGVFDAYGGASNDGAGKLTHVFHSSTFSAAPSFTAQMIRPTTEGTLVAYKHVGCVATEFTISAEVEKPVTLSAKFDFRDVSHTSDPASFVPIVYPADALAYDWSRTAITLKRADNSSVSVDANKFELTGDLGMNVDRRFLKGTALKAKPVRGAVPTYEGTFEAEFSADGLKVYEAFIAGEVCSLTVDLVGLTPGSSVKVECPAIQFTGESPEASVDDLTTMKIPFRILDPGDGTNDAVKLTYVEHDPAFVG